MLSDRHIISTSLIGFDYIFVFVNCCTDRNIFLLQPICSIDVSWPPVATRPSSRRNRPTSVRWRKRSLALVRGTCATCCRRRRSLNPYRTWIEAIWVTIICVKYFFLFQFFFVDFEINTVCVNLLTNLNHSNRLSTHCYWPFLSQGFVVSHYFSLFSFYIQCFILYYDDEINSDIYWCKHILFICVKIFFVPLLQKVVFVV